MSQPKMASEKELSAAIKDLLKSTGCLKKMEAEVRAKVTEALQNKQSSIPNVQISPPSSSDEVLLINDLIREYLEWNGYLYTASVMASEAGLPVEKKSRTSLCLEVGVKDDDRSSALPLLTNIVIAYTERIRKKINKAKKEGL